jgi:hypothetical protein
VSEYLDEQAKEKARTEVRAFGKLVAGVDPYSISLTNQSSFINKSLNTLEESPSLRRDPCFFLPSTAMHRLM